MKRLLAIAATCAAAAGVAVLGTGAAPDDDAYTVRAVFDNAFGVIPGLDVKVAGVRVGSVEGLSVTDDRRAAVVLRIDDPGFQDFRRDARCQIRPQGLIGEKFVECTLTEPRPQGSAPPPELPVIRSGDGAGQRLLPVTNTAKSVDVDLINNVMRLPERQRLAIILNELGTGLAGRGAELRETIRRANPAFYETNRVLALLARQNRVMAKLARDSDQILRPLARDRRHVQGFVENAGSVARATAERRVDLEANFEKLPVFLRELRPTMTRLGAMSDELTPMLGDLRGAAPEVNRLMRELGPVSEAGIPALKSLGEAADVGRPALVRSKPIIDDLRRMTAAAKPVAADLAALTTSFRDTGGIERFMDFLFFQVAAINGFDEFGHYLRAMLIANLCTTYATETNASCSANFSGEDDASAASAASLRRSPALVKTDRLLRGEDPDRVLAEDDRSADEAPAAPPAAGSRKAPAKPTAVRTPAPSASDSDPAAGLADYLLGD